MLLSANAGAAQRAGQTEIVQLLEALGETAVAIIQERMTPEERFINELLLAETPTDATRMLRKNVAKITPDLVRRLNELADQEEQLANKPIADRLRQLARESGAMLF
jgi:tRNA A22 N-methylase